MRSTSILPIAGLVFAAMGNAYAKEPLNGIPPVAATPKLRPLLDGRAVGRAVNCVPMRSFRSSQIVDGIAIIFPLGDILFINQPVTGSRSLSVSMTLVPRTHGSQLCSGEVVDIVDPNTHAQMGSIILGKFVPYRLLPRNSYSRGY